MDDKYSCFDDPQNKADIQNKTLRRLDTLVESFDKLREMHFFEGLNLNKGIAYSMIESYYIDLQRAKCFHNIEYADQYKKAAFTIKWLMKLRPIMIENTVKDKELTEKQILANEIFALIIALNFLDIEIDKISEKHISNLIYILRYRNLEELVLATLMYLLECAVKKKTPSHHLTYFNLQ